MEIQDGPISLQAAAWRISAFRTEQVQRPRREIQVKRRDGRELTAELSITALRTRDTFVFNCFIRDITEQNRTQQTLQQQAEELRRIFETSQDLIMVMDSRGSLVQISPSCEAILGYPPDEMIGRSGNDFIHPDHLENSRQEMRALRRGERPKIADTRCVHKDGRKVWLSWLGVWSDPVKRFFFVGRDMTESRWRRKHCAKASSWRAASSIPRSTPLSRTTRATASWTGIRRPKRCSGGRARKPSART